MTKKLILVLMIALLGYSASITLLDTQWNSTPKSLSMEHLLNIIKYQTGEATPTQVNFSAEYIKQLAQENIKDKVKIYLMNNQHNDTQIPSVQITNYLQSTIPRKIWKQAAQYLPSFVKPTTSFSIVDGLNMTIKDILEETASSASRVVIWASSKQHEKIKHQLSQPKRLLQTASDSSYLIKFFFSILFIFVCFGVLSSISNMKNQRETLLYAKFVADVGGR